LVNVLVVAVAVVLVIVATTMSTAVENSTYRASWTAVVSLEGARRLCRLRGAHPRSTEQRLN
jgi:hypothetical protein